MGTVASTAAALVAGLIMGVLLGYVVSTTILPHFFTAEELSGKGKQDAPRVQAEMPPDENPPRIQVVVVGDIGRSPRMQYHALSIVRHGRPVDLVGYLDSPLHPDLEKSDLVTVHPLPLPPKALASLPFFIAGPLKVIQQTIALWVAVLRTPSRPSWIIVQNPPSIPALHVAFMASLVLWARIMIDWHNYGWSILATTRGAHHPFIMVYRKYEQFWGRAAATANLAVTDAMAADLRGASFGITTPVHTLHDRPAAHLQPILEPSHRHATLHRLEPTRSEADAIMAGTTRLLVSSTSWTPDEDFQMLLDALMSYTSMYDEYQRKPGQSGQIPRVLVVITGRGPQKSKYEALVGDLTAQGRLSGVEISTAWLSTEDYAALLACADLGVCLHTSSSGVDLPMKVVDMFGAGIPVVAYGGYKSFSELVSEGVNGHGFTTVPELAKILSRLLSAGGKRELVRLKAGAVKEGSLRWDEEWDRVVAKQVGVV